MHFLDLTTFTQSKIQVVAGTMMIDRFWRQTWKSCCTSHLFPGHIPGTVRNHRSAVCTSECQGELLRVTSQCVHTVPRQWCFRMQQIVTDVPLVWNSSHIWQFLTVPNCCYPSLRHTGFRNKDRLPVLSVPGRSQTAGIPWCKEWDHSGIYLTYT